GPKYAFATLLSGPSGDEDWAKDNYLTGTRLLAYQLLHNPQTRSKNKGIPFVVFVGENVSEAKRERLRKDGAVIKEVKPIHADWIKPAQREYNEVLSKLRLWEHTEYDRICLLDSDIVLNKPIDGVFDDPAVALQTTGTNRSAEIYKEDEGELPTTYAFAAAMETSPDHNYPPQVGNGDYIRDDNLNAGFMVFRPDKELFEHYMKILAQPDRFNSALPEQSLLNYAHRWSANMPWKPIGNTWNVNFPYTRDIEAGVASVHEKFWAPAHQEMKPWLEAWRYRMEGFFEAMDEL
ncbi:putative glycosyl transferase family 8 family, partial [Westerdykella ornata]